ncbi:MAG: hypothetical protein GY710_11420 [Desulfobacteraceae bacterium]|nr:hypothetical protein [Desulfobacteraceae bacterium]
MKKDFRPFIIDVEASGFGSSSYPIEIGLALEKESRYCSLIIPVPDWTHWDKNAEGTHHLSREELMLHGKPALEVAKQLNAILQQATVFSDGWEVDKAWITRLFASTGIRRLFSVSPLERILSQAQMNIWHETKNQIIQTLNLTRHRASSDAFIIQETYMQTRARTR